MIPEVFSCTSLIEIIASHALAWRCTTINIPQCIFASPLGQLVLCLAFLPPPRSSSTSAAAAGHRGGG